MRYFLTLLLSLSALAQVPAKHITSHSSVKLSESQQRFIYESVLDELCDDYFSKESFPEGHNKCVRELSQDDELFKVIIDMQERSILTNRYVGSWQAKLSLPKLPGDCEIYRGGLLHNLIKENEFLRICRIDMGKGREFINALIGSTDNKKFRYVGAGVHTIAFRTKIPFQISLFKNGWRSWPESMFSYAISRSYQGVSLDQNRETYNRVSVQSKKVRIGDGLEIEVNKDKNQVVQKFPYVEIAGRRLYLNGTTLFNGDAIQIDTTNSDRSVTKYYFDMDAYKLKNGAVILAAQEPASIMDMAWLLGYRVKNVMNFPKAQDEQNAMAWEINEVLESDYLGNPRKVKMKGILELVFEAGKPAWAVLDYQVGGIFVLKRVDAYAYDFSTIMLDFDKAGETKFFIKLSRDGKTAMVDHAFKKDAIEYKPHYYLKLHTDCKPDSCGDKHCPEVEPTFVPTGSDLRKRSEKEDQ